jgi:exodeoxyribonuclease VII large subunit
MRFMAKDINSTTRSCFTREDEALGRLYIGLRRGPVKIIRPEREKAELSRKLLHSFWNQQVTGSRKGIALKAQIIHSADPARQLEKGYSILRHKDGKLIRKRKDITAGETVQTEISDGFLESKITSTREKK